MMMINSLHAVHVQNISGHWMLKAGLRMHYCYSILQFCLARLHGVMHHFRQHFHRCCGIQKQMLRAWESLSNIPLSNLNRGLFFGFKNLLNQQRLLPSPIVAFASP